MVFNHVKYNETYYEVLDHVISSLELESDEKFSFHQKLNQIWNDDFGGYANLPILEKQRVKIVNKQIGKRLWQLFFSYFKLPLLFITFTLGMGFYYLSTIILTELINNKVTVILLFIAGFVPISICLYMYFKLKKYSSIKPSIKDSKVYHSSGFGLSILNCIIFLPVFFNHEAGAILKTLSPSLLVLITVCFTIYALSYFRLYKETFKMELAK
jgi:hypothetical protein